MTRALSLAAILMAGLALPVVADQTATKAEPGTAAANSAGCTIAPRGGGLASPAMLLLFAVAGAFAFERRRRRQ